MSKRMIGVVMLLLTLAWDASLAAERNFSGRVEKGVTYVERGRKSLRLDVYLPEAGAAPVPAVVVIHGGGFIGGFRGMMDPLCRALAAAGMAAFNIDYRLSPRYQFPAPTEDARCALRWVARHAKEYGADPGRLGVTGESAGAYLAAMTVFPGPVAAERTVEFFRQHLGVQ